MEKYGRVVALALAGVLASTLSARAQNLLSKAGFEEYAPPSLGAPGWVSDRTTAAKSETNQPHSGAEDGACWSTDGTDCGIYQDVTVSVSGTYTYTVWAAADVAGGLLGANVNGTGVASANVSAQGFGQYQSYAMPFAANAGDTIRVWMYSPAIAGSPGHYVVIDDASLVAAGSTGGCNTGVAPTCYAAITDTATHAAPSAPTPGAAGWTYTEPVFNASIVRITDANTRPGVAGRSYRVPSTAHAAAWNTTGTYFYVVSNDGTIVPFAFDAGTMTAARIPGSGDGGLTLPFDTEAQFSIANPNLIWGGWGGDSIHQIRQYDFSSGATTTLIDLDQLVGGLAGTYIGAIGSSAGPSEDFVVNFGGGGQDSHPYAMWFPVGNIGARKLLDTWNSQINGTTIAPTLGFHLHSVAIDKTGQYVFLYPASADFHRPHCASQVYVWDTATDNITPITSGIADDPNNPDPSHCDGGPAMLPGGHDSQGYGVWVNQDCCTHTSWDAAQWQFRSIDALQATKDLIDPVQTPKEVSLSDHSTWNNAQPNRLVPFVSSTFRSTGDPDPARAWDNEIIAVQTDVPAGQTATVWRFGHHQSIVDGTNFWDQPIANVSPNGQWVIFTTNWGRLLGMDTLETSNYRQDVFLVHLPPGQ